MSQLQMCASSYAYTHIYIHTHIQATHLPYSMSQLQMCASSYTYTHIYIQLLHIYTHIHTHIYTHIHTHTTPTHIHTYTYKLLPTPSRAIRAFHSYKCVPTTIPVPSYCYIRHLRGRQLVRKGARAIEHFADDHPRAQKKNTKKKDTCEAVRLCAKGREP
jgi:hypothetical protein